MSRWYRAYEGTVTDAKLAEAAIVAGCSRSVSIAAWHAILENAATINDGGRIDIPSRRVAAILVEPFESIQKLFEAFSAIGLLEDDAVAAWKRRQYESDVSTDRSRKHRQRQRNDSATLQQQDETPPETETETETEREGGRASAPPPKLPREKKRAVALPTAFTPDWNAASAVGLSRVEAEREFQKFKNHAAQNGRVCVNWQAAWSNWCIKAAEYMGKPQPKAEGAPMASLTVKSPGWNLWKAHYRDTGQSQKAALMDKFAADDRSMTFPSESPGG